MPTGCIVEALKKMGYEDATEEITWDIAEDNINFPEFLEIIALKVC